MITGFYLESQLSGFDSVWTSHVERGHVIAYFGRNVFCQFADDFPLHLERVHTSVYLTSEQHDYLLKLWTQPHAA